MFRKLNADGSTQWAVGSPAILEDCYPDHGIFYFSRPVAGNLESNSGPPSYAPDAIGYGWSEHAGFDGVHIVVGLG